MEFEKTVWVVDDYKLRREGMIGVLSSWASDSSVSLKQVERPEHICPTELLAGNFDAQQLCLLGIGGQSLADKKVASKIEALRDVLDDRPLAVILDDFDDREIKLAVKLGVRGLIGTFLDTEVAIRAIEFVMAGGAYLPAMHGAHDDIEAVRTRASRDMTSQIEERLVEDLPESKPRYQTGSPELSERQKEVLEALKRGLSNKLIARELNLSEATVKIHMRSLIQKFGAANRTQVALMANDPSLEPKRTTSARYTGRSGPSRSTTH